MDTLGIAVLIYFGLCLKIALIAVALIILNKLRLPPSKGSRELKREGGQREESAREEKTESRPVLKSSSGRGAQKQAVSSGGKPLEPEPAANEAPPQAQKTGKASVTTEPKSGAKPPRESSAGNTSGGETKRMNGVAFSTRFKAGKPSEPIEDRKQVQSKNTAPVESAKPMAASKDGSVIHTASLGPPQPQAAFTVSRSGEKPPQESSAGNTGSTGEKNDPSRIAEPAQIGKEGEASMDIEPGAEDNQASSETPAETTDSDETNEETPQKQKSGLGDLADLFATSASDFSEKSKLAEQVKEVDVNDILQEGLGLLGKVKKSDD